LRIIKEKTGKQVFSTQRDGGFRHCFVFVYVSLSPSARSSLRAGALPFISALLAPIIQHSPRTDNKHLMKTRTNLHRAFVEETKRSARQKEVKDKEELSGYKVLSTE
jgi:hypothetical protein